MRFRESFFDNFLLRASNRHALNDPFEVEPSQDFWLDAFIQMQIETDKYSGKSEDFIRRSVRASNMDSIKKIFIDRYDQNGIISFTETNDNLLMWSHYADEHKGIAVEFDVDNAFFNEMHISDDAYIGKVSPVLYRKERLAKLGDYLIEPYFHKSDEWIYEKEHRILLPLGDSDARWVDKEYFEKSTNKYFRRMTTRQHTDQLLSVERNFPIGVICRDYESAQYFYFMFKIPRDAINAIYAGCNISSEKFEVLKHKIKANLPNAKLYKANKNRFNYSIEFDEITDF